MAAPSQMQPAHNTLLEVNEADLPPAGAAGRLARLKDDRRCIVMDTGFEWAPVGGDALDMRMLGFSPAKTAAQNTAVMVEAQAAIESNPTEHAAVVFPVGTFDVDELVVKAANNDNRLAITGQGVGNTVLRGNGVAGNVVKAVGSDIVLSNLTVGATAARTAGAGHGVALVPSAAYAGTTVPRVVLRHVTVENQPGDGVNLERPEHALLEHVWSQGNGGKGIYVHDNGSGLGISNRLVQCRARLNGGVGIDVSGLLHGRLEDCQALANGGAQQVFVHGGARGWLVVNPDIEALTGAGDALVLSGDRHTVLGGFYQGTLRGIVASTAKNLTVIGPSFRGLSAGSPMSVGVFFDAASNYGQVINAPAAATNVTTVVSVDPACDGVVSQQDGEVRFIRSTVRMDTLSERTTDAGVTVDGCLIKDGAAANALLLEGSNKAFFRNASNLDAGTVPAARLPNAAPAARGAVLQAAAVADPGAMQAPDAPAVYAEADMQTELNRLKANDDELHAKLAALLVALRAGGSVAP